MPQSSATSYLAIDGGGTYCRFVLMYRGQRFEMTGGSANVSTDFEGAKAVLTDGMASLSDQSGVPTEALYALPAFIGVAGVTGPSMATRLSKALPFQLARYADDRPAALRGALGADQGFVAHCGTGSFFGAQKDGKQHVTGGWGSVLGDEASAMWVGKRLLSQTLRCVDGLAPHTALSEATLAKFGDAPAIVRFAGQADPAAFGALAPSVTDAHANGDTLAITLMSDAANHVADELAALGWQPGLTICLTGGIGPYYADLLPEAMRTDVKPPLDDPIVGAEALAQDYAQEISG